MILLLFKHLCLVRHVEVCCFLKTRLSSSSRASDFTFRWGERGRNVITSGATSNDADKVAVANFEATVKLRCINHSKARVQVQAVSSETVRVESPWHSRAVN